MKNLLKQGLNERIQNKIICPHCESNLIVKYGFYKGEQRYRCKSCSKTFNPYTGTLLHWSHYKDKWEAFIETMGKDMSLREAGEAIGVHYSTLFFWRHKIMGILSYGNEEKLNGTIEMMKLDLPFMNKYHNGKPNEEDEYFEGDKPVRRDMVHLTFLFQRNNRLNSYVYRDKTRVMDFIQGIAGEIDINSRICLNVNYPFRLPLLHYKFKVMGTSGRIGRKKFCYNAVKVMKLLTGFNTWMRKFHGVSSKYLNKYVSYYKTHQVFNTMEYILLSNLTENTLTSNSQASIGDVLF